jgi:hypothetical protein
MAAESMWAEMFQAEAEGVCGKRDKYKGYD